jgi:Fe-S-cluster containining protein
MTATATPYALLPDDTQRWLIDIYSRACIAIKDALARHGRAPGLGVAIARARVEFLESELQPVVEAVARAGTPVDCRRGCTSCCTLKVEITPDEVFALVAEVEATLDAKSLAEVKARAVEVDRRGGSLPPGERYLLRMYCPILEPGSGACRGHAVRPAGCQGYLSLDRRRCDASSLGAPATILSPVASGLIRDAVMSAQIIVLQQAGYDQLRVELSAGLAAAWSDPAAEQRWLAGGRAFPSISSPPHLAAS